MVTLTFKTLTFQLPSLSDKILDNADLPLKIGHDKEAKRDYIQSPFNKDKEKESFR